MNPQVMYQTTVARIDELHRQAGASRLAVHTARGRRGRRRVPSFRRWRAGRGLGESIAARFA